MSTSPTLDAALHARLLDVDPPDARRFVHAEARRLEPLLTDGAVDAVVARVLARVHGFGSRTRINGALKLALSEGD